MRVLSFKQLRAEKGIPYTRVHLSRLINDGKFPLPIRLSEWRIAWREEDIDAWLASRPVAREMPKAWSPDTASAEKTGKGAPRKARRTARRTEGRRPPGARKAIAEARPA